MSQSSRQHAFKSAENEATAILGYLAQQKTLPPLKTPSHSSLSQKDQAQKQSQQKEKGKEEEQGPSGVDGVGVSMSVRENKVPEFLIGSSSIKPDAVCVDIVATGTAAAAAAAAAAAPATSAAAAAPTTSTAATASVKPTIVPVPATLTANKNGEASTSSESNGNGVSTASSKENNCTAAAAQYESLVMPQRSPNAAVESDEEVDNESTIFIPPPLSCYGDFIRWLEYESILKKVLLSALIPQSSLRGYTEPEKHSTENVGLINLGLEDFRFPSQNWGSRSSYVNLEQELREGLVFYGAAIPLGDRNAIRTAINIDNFFKGIKFFTEKLWPLTFYPLLLHDFICYFAYPNDRYGNKLWQVFAGYPSNEQTLTTYLNESYWWPAILVGVPIFLGINRILQNCCRSDSIRLTRIFQKHKDQANFFIDFIQRLNPLYPLRRQLNQAEGMLLWDRSRAEKLILLDSLINLADQNKNLTRLSALKILANVVNSLDERDLERLSALGVDVKVMQAYRDQKALKKLKYYSSYRIENDQKSLVRFLYVNYLQWSIGRLEKRRYLEPIFWLYELGIIYAKFRLYESLAQFIYQQVELLQEWHQCYQENKVFTYMPQSAKRECTICGDWKIYYPDVFAAQSCVDGVLKQQQTVSNVLSILDRVEPFGISSIDLSKQNWTSWDQSFLRKVLQAVNKTSRGYLEELDLSCETTNTQPLNATKAQTLATFLSSIRIERINFNNQNFSPEVVQILVNSMVNNSFVDIKLAGNNLGVEGAGALTQTLPTLTALREIDFSRTNTTDETMQILAVGFRTLKLDKLILQGNNFAASGINSLVTNLKIVRTLDLSGNNFRGIDNLNILARHKIINLICARTNIGDQEFMPLVNNLTNSSLIVLNVSDNELTMIAAQALGGVLPNTTLQELFLSGNKIYDEGLGGLSAGLPNSSVTALGLSNTRVGDFGMQIFSGYLPQTNITKLELAANDFSALSIKNFSKALLISQVQEISFALNSLTDDDIKPLLHVLEQPNCTLTKIDFRSNLITAAGAEALANALRNNTSVEALILSGNKIEDGGFINLVSILPNSTISQFECEDCKITETGANALAGNLIKTKIRELALSGNQLNDNSAWKIAKALIQPIPNSQDLGNSEVSRDFARAVHDTSATTNATALSLRCDGIENFGARSLCRVLPSTPMRPEDLNLNGNSIDPKQVDMESCWISPGSRTQPPFFTVVQGITSHMSIVRDTKNFLQTIFTIISEIGIEQKLIPCLAAFALAFRQEAFQLFIQQLTENNQKTVRGYVNSVEGLVLANFTEMALRIKYHGAPSIVHDITLVSKTVYQETPKEKATANNNFLTFGKVAVGIGMVAGVYGIGWAVSTVVGSPIVAAIALPIILNGKKIITETVKGYQRYGFFGGACSALEALAFSAPGGRVIEKALTKQEQNIARSSIKSLRWKKGFLLATRQEQDIKQEVMVETVDGENKSFCHSVS